MINEGESLIERRKPAYIQVHDRIRNGIIAGEYLTSLPSEAVLTENFGVSRGTLRQALGLLKAEGLIEPRQGIGTIIKAVPPAENVGQIRYDLLAPNFRSTLLRLGDILTDPKLGTNVKSRIIQIINSQLDLVDDLRGGTQDVS
jgi:DNA-binding GntR family transcriptional regulator